MAEEIQYPSRPDYKRKYEDQTTPPPPSSIPRRPTGFSAPIVSQSSDLTQPPPSYNNVPPPLDEIQLAKQKAQEIAARLFSNAEAKRPRVENNGATDDSSNDFTQKPLGQQIPSSQQVGMSPPPPPSSALPIPYGFQGSSKKIDIPNGRVGVIIGKAGETIKYLQVQSGAKIQVTRDMDADRNSETRTVELVGNPEQISKAEQLIKDVIAEAEAGGSGTVARRFVAQPGAEQYTMKVPNNKVGLIIGKGGETIKNMQTRSGARIQLIPLHLPPGDTSMERNLYIDGSQEQIEAAKQLVNEVISENRVRNSSMGGGYSQQGYRAPSWGPPAPPQMQQPGYGYMQPGAYPGPAPQYNSSSQPPYSGYPPQPTSTGAPSGWDQATALPSQQTTQGTGYDYYNQASSQQQPHGGPSTTTDTSGYNYSQAPASNYNQPQVSYGESNYSQPPNGQQGYSDGYGGGYPASTAQPGYGSQANLQTGYDQQQGYNSVPPYGTSVNPSQDGVAPSYGAQGGPTQVPPTQQVTPPVQPPAATQQGFASQPLNTAPTSYPQGPAQPGYGIPPTSQPGYGGQLLAQTGYGQSPVVAQPGYGPSQGQKLPPSQGYPHSLPPSTQSGYAQPESGSYRPPPSGYGSVGPQPGYGPVGSQGQQPYSAASASQPGYGQVPQIHSGYSQAPVYSKDNGGAGGTVAPSGSQPVQLSGVAKASPPS